MNPSTAPGAKTQSAFKIARSAFWEGLTKPSRIAAAAMVFSFVCMLIFAAWFFSPGTIAGRMGDYLPRSGKDAAGFATVKAIRLGHNGITRPTLIALGSSTTAQSLSHGKHLTSRLNEGAGDKWQFVSLTTPQQSPIDQLALLETALDGHTADSPPVVILLSASGLRMTWTPERIVEDRFVGRIGLSSNWASEELARFGKSLPRRTGSYIVDNFNFICLNGTEALMRIVAQKPATEEIAAYAYGAQRVGSERGVPILGERYSKALENADVYFAMLERLLDRLRASPNVHVAFLDETFAPDALASLGLVEASKNTTARIIEFSERVGVEYWTPAADAALTADDFHDALHVDTGDPQVRVQDALAEYLLDYFARTGL